MTMAYRIFGHFLTVVIGAALLATAFLLLAPLVVTLIMSFDARPYLGPMPPPEYSLRWFEKLFSRTDLLDSLMTSLLVGSVTMVLAGALGMATAVFLDSRTFRAKPALEALFLSPLIVPPVVTGFGLLLILSNLGLVNGVARIVCGHLVITFPYALRTTLASLAGRERVLIEAARNLGASSWQAFWTVTFPLVRPGIVAGGVFVFAISLDDVAVASFLATIDTTTLPVALVATMRTSFDMTIAAAAVVLLVSTTMVMLLLGRFLGLNHLVGQGFHAR